MCSHQFCNFYWYKVGPILNLNRSTWWPRPKGEKRTEVVADTNSGGGFYNSSPQGLGSHRFHLMRIRVLPPSCPAWYYYCAGEIYLPSTGNSGGNVRFRPLRDHIADVGRYRGSSVWQHFGAVREKHRAEYKAKSSSPPRYWHSA